MNFFSFHSVSLSSLALIKGILSKKNKQTKKHTSKLYKSTRYTTGSVILVFKLFLWQTLRDKLGAKVLDKIFLWNFGFATIPPMILH